MDYQQWRTIHRQQLESIPERFHEALFRKLCTETFDAGEYLLMCPSSSGWSIKVNNEDGLKIDDESIFIIDHYWTYLLNNYRQQLLTVPGLAHRIANLLDIIEPPTTPTNSDGEEEEQEEETQLNGDNDSESDHETNHTTQTRDEEEEDEEEEEEEEEEEPSQELIDKIMQNLWKYSDCYTIANMPVPVWYIMEDYAVRIPHSLTPNVSIIPFFNILTQLSYSVMWPLNDISYGETLSRNRVPSRVTSELSKQCHSLPWLSPDSLPLSDPLWAELDTLSLSPNPEKFLEDLPDTLPETTPTLTPPFKVYSDMNMINRHLTHPLFKLVTNEEDANILWYFDHFKDFKSLNPDQFINQFPCENVLTCKDLLVTVARRTSKNHTQNPTSLPEWIPESYNLYYELPHFVREYKRRERSGEENVWILKPWNLGRSMDIFITSDLTQIIRLSQSLPRVVSRYITNPVLFYREGIGKVKMDVRYIVLLVSVKPLVLYTYNVFWLRFANKPFILSSFNDYDIHFTVMNYKDDSDLMHVESVDFIPLFHDQYPDQSWADIQDRIYSLIIELFTGAASAEPPAGITCYPQSRSMYALDILLEWSPPHEGCGCNYIQPKICEVNFCPDCTRAIQYHPSFINEVFETLFIPENQHNDELPVTKLTK